MRTASRLSAAVVVLAAGLALTACGSGGSGSSSNAGGTASPVASTSASTSASAPASTGTSGGTGSPAATGGNSGGSGGSSASSARCTTADVKMTVTGPDGHANDQQPARATLHVINQSAHSCTLTGFPGVQVADDQDKSSPVDATRHTGMQVQPVNLVPGQVAQADLTFSDVNTQGSASGAGVCAVQGSKVMVILPDTTTQKSVPVTGGVDNGTLDICGPLTVDPFSAGAAD